MKYHKEQYTDRKLMNGTAIMVAGILAVFTAIGLSGCDFEVLNPGPIHDEFLDDPGAREAIVNGIGRNLSEGLNWIGYTSAAVSREIHPAGATGSYGITVRWQNGQLDEDETSTHWNLAQRARWSADHSLERLEENMDPGDFSQSEFVTQAYLWQGYAYRLLGENMCEAVIDGSEVLGDNSVYLQEAVDAFTNAFQNAEAGGYSEMRLAALAGRASAHMHLGNWTEAVADAEQVLSEGGRDFSYVLPYNDLEQDQYNRIYEASADNPYRAHTVWQTPYEEYYLETADPRTPWDYEVTDSGIEYNGETVRTGDATVGTLGHVPWLFQMKYQEPSAPIELSSGTEMELIIAEDLLREGQWPEAMAIINDIRSDVGVDEWEVADEEEAWEALMRERGIELWLEARRMSDLRRWVEDPNVPDRFHDLEWDGGDHPMLALPERDLCFPVPDSERETNPNIPEA